MTFELTQEYLDHIVELIEQQDAATLKSELEELYPADITGILYEIESQQAHYLVNQLDTRVGAEILADLDRDERRDFLKTFISEEI
ncbi:MAG: magnesium transporter, partial [Bacteroidetes bacterium]|nr:magnesium transporter [Bacteroidota bacterium]